MVRSLRRETIPPIEMIRVKGRLPQVAHVLKRRMSFSENRCPPRIKSGAGFVRDMRLPPAAECLERALAEIFGLGAELLLDPQELVVFGGAIGAGERAGLDLPAVRGDRQIGGGG